jgi:hypothetical protein
MYGVFGRKITKYTVIYGVYIQGFGRPLHYHTDTRRAKRDQGFNTPGLTVMHNKTPRWNEEVSAYVPLQHIMYTCVRVTYICVYV